MYQSRAELGQAIREGKTPAEILEVLVPGFVTFLASDGQGFFTNQNGADTLALAVLYAVSELPPTAHIGAVLRETYKLGYYMGASKFKPVVVVV